MLQALLHLIKVNIEFMLIFLFGLTKLLYFHRQGASMFHEAQNCYFFTFVDSVFWT